MAFPQKRVITCRGDAGMLVPEIVAAGGGLLFAFDHATIAGKIVLTLLAVVSIFSWSIMITKLRVIRFARKQNAHFLAAFHKDRQPLRLFEKNARFPGAPVFNVYRAGCEEMTFHLLGSSEVDETFRARLEIADKISPAQMGAVQCRDGTRGGRDSAFSRIADDSACHCGERFAFSRIAGNSLGRDGRVHRSGGSRFAQPRRDGAWCFWRSHNYSHRVVRGDSGNVRLQLSRYQHSRDHRRDGQFRCRARIRV